MIQIEAIGTIRDVVSMEPGDRLTVDDKLATYYCANGWAKAVNGEVPTGERVIIKTAVNPNKVTISGKIREAK